MQIRLRLPLSHRRVSISCLLMLMAVVVICAVVAVHGGPLGIVRAEDSGYLYAPTRRFGVGVSRAYGEIGDYDIGAWSLGWYSDWCMSYEPSEPWGIEYVQLVSTSPDWEYLEAVVAHNPGSLWIVGNEPENRWVGNLRPEDYAAVYHDVYHCVKRGDPVAQVAIGGVTQPTPLRLAWLDATLAAYEAMYDEPMPVNVWNIHMQILDEKIGSWGCGLPVGIPDGGRARHYTIQDNANVDAFEQLIREFCEWLVAHGERDKPLIISEYGVLLPSDILTGGDAARGDVMVKQFMWGTFHFLLTAKDPRLGYTGDEYRLVQRWLWYSLNDRLNTPESPVGFNGGLFDWRDPTELTTFGRTFENYMLTLQGKRIVLPLVGRGRGW